MPAHSCAAPSNVSTRLCSIAGHASSGAAPDSTSAPSARRSTCARATLGVFLRPLPSASIAAARGLRVLRIEGPEDAVDGLAKLPVLAASRRLFYEVLNGRAEIGHEHRNTVLVAAWANTASAVPRAAPEAPVIEPGPGHPRNWRGHRATRASARERSGRIVARVVLMGAAMQSSLVSLVSVSVRARSARRARLVDALALGAALSCAEDPPAIRPSPWRLRASRPAGARPPSWRTRGRRSSPRSTSPVVSSTTPREAIVGRPVVVVDHRGQAPGDAHRRGRRLPRHGRRSAVRPARRGGAVRAR